MLRVGLISDTHGPLRPEALAFLRGADLLVHAGDIGPPAVLDALAAIAPLTVVRGNNDRGAWAAGIPEVATLRAGDVVIVVVHDASQLDAREARTRGARVVVSGHSHQPSVHERDGLLHVNPGSAGPRRFRLPVSAGELFVDGDRVRARTVDLMADVVESR
jgi:putative phosphoesterase